MKMRHVLKALFGSALVLYFLLPSGVGVAIGQDQEASKQTAPERTSEALFSLGLVADIQYADVPANGSRHYRSSLEKLREAVKVFNSNAVDRVMDVGDVIDRGPESFDAVMAIYEELEAPLSIALGNHDFPSSRAHTLKALGMDRSYFAVDYPDWRIVVLDGNDVSLLARPADHKKHQKASRLLQRLKEANAPNAKAWNGAIGQEQLEWFDGKLSEAEEEERSVLVFCHFPVYPKGSHTLWNRDEVVKVIDSHSNVVAWFNGHNHAGAYAEKHGVHYLTLPGLVETRRQNAFVIIEVYEDSLKINGYGRVKDRILSRERHSD